jgi:hypothetical protein
VVQPLTGLKHSRKFTALAGGPSPSPVRNRSGGFSSDGSRSCGTETSGPQKILAQGTDWRFLNELKKELTG